MTSSLLLICRRVVAYWRAIVLLLILACVALLVARSDDFGSFELILLALLLLFIASQLFWIGQILYLAERFIPDKHRRAWFAILTGSVYLFVFLYSFPDWGLGHIIRAADYARTLGHPGDPLVTPKRRQTSRDGFVQRGRHDLDGMRDAVHILNRHSTRADRHIGQRIIFAFYSP